MSFFSGNVWTSTLRVVPKWVEFNVPRYILSDSVYSNKTICFQSVCCYILLLFPLLQVDSKHCHWNPCESSQALKTPHKTLALVHSELVSRHPPRIIKVNFDMLSMYKPKNTELNWYKQHTSQYQIFIHESTTNQPFPQFPCLPSLTIPSTPSIHQQPWYQNSRKW